LPDCISELETYTEEHCTEDVYKDLINKSSSHIAIIKMAAFGSTAGKGGDDDPSGMGAFEPNEGLTKEGKEEAEENIKDIVRRAAITAKMCGDASLSGMQTVVEELLKPKVDWRKQLTAFLTNRKPGIKSWNKPNKRLMHMGIVLPGILKQRSGSIAVAIDTSGSISKKEMRMFLSELNNIRKGLNIEKLVVVYIDSRIQRIDEFESDDDVELRNIQGGGTAFIPFFEWLNKQQDIDASVYFTDGYAQFPTHVHVPNIWCMTSTAKAPSHTGDTICLQPID
jgi:predicted metal-dependent peptidase